MLFYLTIRSLFAFCKASLSTACKHHYFQNSYSLKVFYNIKN
jgi:hypothetical protein